MLDGCLTLLELSSWACGEESSRLRWAAGRSFHSHYPPFGGVTSVPALRYRETPRRSREALASYLHVCEAW